LHCGRLSLLTFL